MNAWTKVEIVSIFAITLGVPLSFLMGFIFNSKLKFIERDYSSYIGKYYADNTAVGLIFTLLFIVAVFSVMTYLDKKLHSENY